MIKIPEGTYTIGSNRNLGFSIDKEGPEIQVHIESFYIAPYPVTNAEFKRFVEATGYKTDAEMNGNSFVLKYFLNLDDLNYVQTVPNMENWAIVEGACWKHPYGKQSSIDEIMDHPVVHVSYNDAIAYCEWTGCRLPSEAEWEVAAKGGTQNDVFTWDGLEITPNGEYRCNTWQGVFAKRNDALDGYATTAPVHTYQPNGYGLYQMIGNVWEWCCNPAKIDLACFNKKTGRQFYEAHHSYSDRYMAIKGGSFLCHATHCNRYRIAARNGDSATSSSINMGFRCVKDK